eukprot:g42959.t1
MLPVALEDLLFPIIPNRVGPDGRPLGRKIAKVTSCELRASAARLSPDCGADMQNFANPSSVTADNIGGTQPGSQRPQGQRITPAERALVRMHIRPAATGSTWRDGDLAVGNANTGTVQVSGPIFCILLTVLFSESAGTREAQLGAWGSEETSVASLPLAEAKPLLMIGPLRLDPPGSTGLSLILSSILIRLGLLISSRSKYPLVLD